MKDWMTYLDQFTLSKNLVDEEFALLVCQLALRAARIGNFGVGAVLLDEYHNVIVEGHNEVFSNGFRSDLHAEMVVLNKLETEYKEIKKLGNYTLIISLEPCPMCMARIILAGIGTILYVSADVDGGMVHLKSNLPPVFQHLSKEQSQTWREAECSSGLREAAFHIWDQSRYELENYIIERSQKI